MNAAARKKAIKLNKHKINVIGLGRFESKRDAAKALGIKDQTFYKIWNAGCRHKDQFLNPPSWVWGNDARGKFYLDNKKIKTILQNWSTQRVTA